MKKPFIIVLVIVVLLLGGLYFKLFAQQASYHESISSTDSVFYMKNMNNSNIKIIVADTDQITVNLKGDEDDIKKVRFFRISDSSTEFSFLDENTDVSGTITVPENTLIDIQLSNGTDVNISDIKGKKTIPDIDSFVVDASSVDSIDMGEEISVDSSEESVILDTEALDPSGESDGGEGEGEEDFSACSIGSQAIRNYCCERLKEDESEPDCSGYGHWVFNNLTRMCDYSCESNEADPDVILCSIGSQETRNQCCTQQNINTEAPGCIGEWRFDNLTRLCGFHCYTPEELEAYYGGDRRGSPDTTSQFCSDFEASEDQDECCDYNLRTPLYLGPRPGFPDCIGKWHYDEEDGCQFSCSDYIEMFEILQQIKQSNE